MRVSTFTRRTQRLRTFCAFYFKGIYLPPKIRSFFDKLLYGHSFHLVDPSPWPLVAAFSALFLTFGGVLYMHGYCNGNFLKNFGFFMILFVMFCWWRDVIREATLEGWHTKRVQIGLKMGMILFIVSEIMFFFAFFWAFFHSSFNPSINVGGIWPPALMTTLDPWLIPSWNTVLLLSSGASVTWVHHAIIAGEKKSAVIAFVITIFLATVFTGLQGFEYVTAPFSISDGVLGATFYMATGFHGFHVFIGTCFLTVCLVRLLFGHFTQENHFGFEAAAWYWHFVDIVWLFLFITIYWWGS
jgi:cytochrome c oxidase subunit 3